MIKCYICVKKQKSCIGQSKKIKLLMKGLGLKKIDYSILIENNRANRSMLFRVQHLISISKTNE